MGEQSNRLQGVYASQYRLIRRRLVRRVRSSDSRRQALETIQAMLAQAQREGLPPETVYGGDFEDFCAALLAELPEHYTARQRRQRLTIQIAAGIAAAVFVFGLCAGLYLVRLGAPAVWRDGFAALAQARQAENQPIAGEFYLTLDLARPQENLGQPLYQDKECAITVAGVYPQPDGNVFVALRCQGGYGLRKGRLVSFSAFSGDQAEPPGVRFQAELGGQIFEGGYALPGALNQEGCQCGLLLFSAAQLPQAAGWREGADADRLALNQNKAPARSNGSRRGFVVVSSLVGISLTEARFVNGRAEGNAFQQPMLHGFHDFLRASRSKRKERIVPVVV